MGPAVRQVGHQADNRIAESRGPGFGHHPLEVGVALEGQFAQAESSREPAGLVRHRKRPDVVMDEEVPRLLGTAIDIDGDDVARDITSPHVRSPWVRASA